MRVVACVECGAQFAAHLLRADHRLAVQMSAAFGKVLVLQLHHGRARALEAAHCALHVDGVAKTGVGVHDHGCVHAFGDTRQCVLHFGLHTFTIFAAVAAAMAPPATALNSPLPDR